MGPPHCSECIDGGGKVAGGEEEVDQRAEEGGTKIGTGGLVGLGGCGGGGIEGVGWCEEVVKGK